MKIPLNNMDDMGVVVGPSFFIDYGHWSLTCGEAVNPSLQSTLFSVASEIGKIDRLIVYSISIYSIYSIYSML